MIWIRMLAFVFAAVMTACPVFGQIQTIQETDSLKQRREKTNSNFSFLQNQLTGVQSTAHSHTNKSFLDLLPSTLPGSGSFLKSSSGTIIGSNDGGSLTNLNANGLALGTVPLARIVGLTNSQIASNAAITASKLAVSSGDITGWLGFTPMNRGGDTMTGFLTLSADPTSNLHAATKQWVDGQIATREATANKNQNNGYAGLDGTGKIPVLRLPIMVGSGASHAAGLVPDPGATAGTTKFLREDGTWVAPAGGSPGGSNKQVQFNSSSVFGGATGFEYQSGASPNVLVTGQNAAHVALRVNSATSPTTGPLEVQINGTTRFSVGTSGQTNLNAISAPGSPADGDVWNDSTQKTINARIASITQPLAGVIFTGTADVTDNSSSEISIVPSGVGTTTLPANFFAVGKTIRIALRGTVNTGSANFGVDAILVRLGSTSVSSFQAPVMEASLNNAYWELTFTITCRTTGVAGTMMSLGHFSYLNDFAGSTVLQSAASDATATVTINTTVSNSLDVRWDWTSTGNSITTRIITVEVLN